MRINLSTVKLEEYKLQNADITKDTGFAQKGYKSILRYDTWRQQMCILTETTTSSEDISNIQLSAGEWLEIDVLKDFVNSITHQGATHIYISGSTNDEYEIVDVSIDVIKKTVIKRTESDYFMAYRNYVAAINRDNRSTWNEYKVARDQEEKAEFDELQKFMDAKKVYEKLKHKFE